MAATYSNPYEWTSRKQYSDKSVHRTGEIRAFQEVYGYYPSPDTPLPSIENDDEFAPGSKSCPISLEDDDEVDFNLEEDEIPLAVLKQHGVGYFARKAPVAVTTVAEAPKPKKGISSPPRYHPSVSGKFLASGPAPPRRLRPSSGSKSSKPKSSKQKAIKPKSIKSKSSVPSATASKRSYIESEDEDDFVHHSSYSRNKRARVEDSDDEADEDFVFDHPSTPAAKPKKVKKACTYNKKNHPTTSGKQPITAPKHPSELIRPALRDLPACPAIQNIKTKKGSKWVQYEHDCLYFLIVQQRNIEVSSDVNIKPLMDMNLFKVMAEQLESFNIYRTDGAARNYWNRHGRVKVQWDERIDTWAGRDLVTCSQESKANDYA
ncbi:hypothetical protein BKA64DRAFT_738886 [Cadophora sp. MPI-SDFR-AT-0126]|nr:hypothetical protein BKA64DRAFT_738886 [Leotiomycetes sp. MPI-SDFR-AT-0126]